MHQLNRAAARGKGSHDKPDWRDFTGTSQLQKHATEDE